MAREVELPDDLRPEQRDDVREDREAEPDLLGHRRAPEHVPLLQHDRLQPRPRQIGGAHQAVVAAADHDRVVALGHANLRRRDEWDSPDCTRRRGVDAGSRRRHRGRVSDADPTGGTNQLGVVDPLRVPGLERARRFWRELPMLGRLFVVAAAVDFVAALIGLAGLHSYIDLAVPLAIVTSFLPHYALLVFPVVVLARNPDAGRDTAAPVGLRRDRTRRAAGRAAWPVALPRG